MPKSTVIVFLITISILAGAHLIALELFLYWRHWWFDMPMHFIGGSAATLGAYAFADLRVPSFRAISQSPLAIFVFLLVVIIGWELFEIWGGIPIEDNFFYDTAIDVLMGLFGGFTGYLVATRLKEL